jgi:hypothetical protein
MVGFEYPEQPHPAAWVRLLQDYGSYRDWLGTNSCFAASIAFIASNGIPAAAPFTSTICSCRANPHGTASRTCYTLARLATGQGRHPRSA